MGIKIQFTKNQFINLLQFKLVLVVALVTWEGKILLRGRQPKNNNSSKLDFKMRYVFEFVSY